MTHPLWGFATGLCVLLSGCTREAPPGPTSRSASPVSASAAVERDEQLERCSVLSQKIRRAAALPGAAKFEAKRSEILGRARGEPMLFLREPEPTPAAELPEVALRVQRATAKRGPFARVVSLRRALAGDRPALRALLLPQGYVYSADPIEALALVTRLALTDLFDEDTIYLQRGEVIHALQRVRGRDARYEHADGSRAELLFGDRVATSRDALDAPLHRDARALQDRLGFDRMEVEHASKDGILARLRFGAAWTKVTLASDGAALSLSCFREPQERRLRIEKHLASEAPRRAALTRLRHAVDAYVREALPFDRPRGEETADRDGQLRPAWRFAYLAGRQGFQFDEQWYPVYDSEGRPHPPQVCVDFVLDSFERANDTWYSPRGEPPQRSAGRLDFNAFGIENRRAVLALGEFARERTELFEHERLAPEERIKFRERERFFGFLTEHADRFRAGDIVAIQGLKNDGKIHQHAILIERTDPLSGFPYGLADQMKRPRRRTWEGIMAEAPLRSLLYRIRPKDSVLVPTGASPVVAGAAGTASASIR